MIQCIVMDLKTSFINTFFLSFVPHGHCYFWKPELVWLHALSDGFIAIAYFSIPIGLLYFSQRRKDLPYPWIFRLFSLFILSCGLTHTMEIWTIWHSDYWVSGAIKSVTAVTSLATASVMIPVIPEALMLPSRNELQALNETLEEQVRDRTRSLKLSEERLQLAVQSGNMGIWDWDVEGDRLIWDDRMYAIYGVQPTEFSETYNDWQTRVHPDDLERCRSELQYVLSEGQNYDATFRVIWPDDSIHYIEAHAIVQRDRHGKPLRMTGINQDVTERKQAEAERIQAEKLRLEFNLLETVLETILAGYWDWRIPDHHFYMSPGLKRMLGYDDAELADTPESWQSLIVVDDLQDVLDCFDRHVQSRGEEPYYNEMRCRHKNGSIVWVINVGKVIDWDDSGQPLRMIGCHVDITTLKDAEVKLQKSDAHLRLAQRISKLGSWEFDLHTQAITWSDEVFRMFGRDPEGGTPTFEELQALFHLDDREKHRQTVEQAIATVCPYDIECRILRVDGTQVNVQVKGKPILDSAGDVIQLVGTILDITDRKRTEDYLRQLSDRLTLALQSGAIGTWDWDMVHEATWDERMYEIYGLQNLGRPAIYQDWVDRVHPDDLEATEATLQAAVRGEGEFDVQFRIWRTDGELRWIKATALVQRSDDGHPLRMTGINSDITNQKQAEENLLRTTAQLEASNRELEAFAYSVSHDLRSPLRAIDGFSQALLEDYGDQLDEDAKDYFDRIRHNVQRMGTLIDDLLSLSRISRSEMRYGTVNLSALVKEQVRELRTLEPNRQVEFIIAPDVIVSADPTLMQIVVNNLLRNAWKFSSHHATARIEFGIIRQDKRHIYFIKDDGAGFNMAYASKLFGVFQRLHTMSEFPGTGIGLAIVQRAIRRHGGDVWAEGEVERGATFYFTLSGTP